MKTEVLADLTRFAELEILSADVEPWAEVIRVLPLPREEQAWVMCLYNTYDSLSSAWKVYQRWPTPWDWFTAEDREDGRKYPIMMERRNLFPEGAWLRRMMGYALAVRDNQCSWMASALELDDPGKDFTRLTQRLRTIDQIGRQAAFEFAEFAGKCLGFPVDASDGQLWESSGPRESLEFIYGEQRSASDLDFVADLCRDHLEAQGIPLKWVDFETIVCDFKVMRKGRYYPGKHLAALREEIEEINDGTKRGKHHYDVVLGCFMEVVPEPWDDIKPGIDKAKLVEYRNTGRIIDDPR